MSCGLPLFSALVGFFSYCKFNVAFTLRKNKIELRNDVTR